MTGSVTIGIMCRAAVPGHCKTRLARTIGDNAAARLYSAMLADRIALVDALPARRRLLVVAPENDGVAELSRILPAAGWSVLAQRGTDLGCRLANAMEDLADEAGLVCLVDSDSPALSFARIWPVLTSAIDSNSVVLGPCEDGGYYLIGMNAVQRAIFEGIPWSTDKVLAATRAKCALYGRTIVELPLGWDVDEAGDLLRLEQHLDTIELLSPRTASIVRTLRRGSGPA